jgi:hypothetical protein
MTTETSRYALATRLVEREVIYCVSSLIHTLQQREWDGSDGIDADDLTDLASRMPGSDEYREAARSIDGGVLGVVSDDSGHRYVWTPDEATETGDPDLIEYGDGYDDTELGAWRAGFDHIGADLPDGSEVYEHWIVSTYLAGKLREHGETVVDDVAGLTVWGRCTTGQAISMDYVIQQIAVEMYGDAPAVVIEGEA